MYRSNTFLVPSNLSIFSNLMKNIFLTSTYFGTFSSSSPSFDIQANLVVIGGTIKNGTALLMFFQATEK